MNPKDLPYLEGKTYTVYKKSFPKTCFLVIHCVYLLKRLGAGMRDNGAGVYA